MLCYVIYLYLLILSFYEMIYTKMFLIVYLISSLKIDNSVTVKKLLDESEVLLKLKISCSQIVLKKCVANILICF